MSNAAEMDAQEIINYIATTPKKTPVKLYVREKPGMKAQWGNARVYGGRRGKTVFGDWDELKAILDANADSIDYYDVENDCRNSAVPMLDLKGINARIEPGAIIRDRVEIGDRAVIMMGAIINIGSVIGEGSMIDMGAVLGGRATVGKNCHIGAGTVLAGVVEPASAPPVIIEDDVIMKVARTVSVLAQLFQLTVLFRWKCINQELFHEFVMLQVRRTDWLKSNHEVWVLSLTII